MAGGKEHPASAYNEKKQGRNEIPCPRRFLQRFLYPHNSNELNELLASDEWSGEGTSSESADYVQVAAVKNLMTATKANIQSYSITDNEALTFTDMYPAFDEVIGKPLEAGFKLQYGGKLYKVIQAHTAQADWKPSETPALFGKPCGNAGRPDTVRADVGAGGWQVLHAVRRGVQVREGVYCGLRCRPDRTAVVAGKSMNSGERCRMKRDRSRRLSMRRI